VREASARKENMTTGIGKSTHRPLASRLNQRTGRQIAELFAATFRRARATSARDCRNG
jgi:hypothetical protein